MSDKIDQALEYFKKGFKFGAGVKGGVGASRDAIQNLEELFAHWKAGSKAGEEASASASSEYARHLLAEAGWPLSEAQKSDGQTFKHCDDYIHDLRQPLCLRIWLLRQRVPAVDGMLMDQAGIKPKLFATWQGNMETLKQTIKVRVVMASRFGDVGITNRLMNDHGYDHRVPLEHLSDFREEP